MGLFNTLFGRSRPASMRPSQGVFDEQTAKKLDYIINTLHAGVFRLLHKHYQPIYGDDAKYLCGQILNEALVEEPDNDAAMNYKAKNHELILKEARTLISDPDAKKAISYLYTAQVLRLQMSALSGGNSLALARISDLTKRATELSIEIPNTTEVFDKGDIYSCAYALAEYAEQFAKAN
jgi:hypothetical protein